MKVKENLMQRTKESLVDSAKRLGIKGYSKLNKAGIASVVAEKLLTAECMQEILLSAGDDGASCIKSLIRTGTMNFDDLYKVSDFVLEGYIAADEKNQTIIFCSDAADVFNACFTDEFSQLQERNNTVRAYCEAFSQLYGVIKLDKAYEIYNKQNGDLTKEQFVSTVKSLEENAISWGIMRGSIVLDYIILDNKYDEFVAEQADLPYYIPSKKKIMRYGNGVYYDRTNELIALENYLVKTVGTTEAEAENIANELEFVCSMDLDLSEEMSEVFGSYNVEPTDEQIRKITDLICKVNDNTRKAVYKGHTVTEVLEILRAQDEEDEFAPALNVPFVNEPITAKKVGRNDPCPCGSGKKYKRCCGR